MGNQSKNTNLSSELKSEITTRAKCFMAFFILCGLVLIAISTQFSHEGNSVYFRDFFRELGIVIIVVFTISLIYELFIAKKHTEHFLTKLRNQLQQGESNAVVCAQIGISEIFPTRVLYEARYPLSQLLALLGNEDRIRIMARSLFLIMSKFEELKKAIKSGASIELCLFDPKGPSNVVEVLSDFELFDVQSAISVFKKKIVMWLIADKPPGKVELRYHQVHLFDSFVLLESKSENIAVWDLSFGRDTSAKRVVVLDSKKALGEDLTKRYQLLWEKCTTPKFIYDGKKVTLNNLNNEEKTV